MSSPVSLLILLIVDPEEPLPDVLPLQYLYFEVDVSAESLGQPVVLPGSNLETVWVCF